MSKVSTAFALLAWFAIIPPSMDYFKLLKTLIISILLGFLAFVIVYSANTGRFWGLFFLALFLFFTQNGFYAFLIKYFNFLPRWRVRFLAVFLTWNFLCILAGALFLFFGFSVYAIAGAFFLCAFCSRILRLLVGPISLQLPDMDNKNFIVQEEEPSGFFGLLFFIILYVIVFFILKSNVSTGVVLNPLSVVSPSFISLLFGLLLLSGYLIFTRIKSNTLLFILVALSFLFHSILPFSHQFFYGADGWRHIAVEKSMIDQGVALTAQLSSLPEGLLKYFDIGQLAYAQFHAQNILLNQILKIDFINILKWYMPILFAIIFTILSYEITRTLGYEKKHSLFFVWLAFLPFALLAAGSFTLPVNAGFLLWIFGLLLLLREKDNPTWQGKTFLLFFGALFIFSYTLFFILFWLSVAVIFFTDKKIFVFPKQFINAVLVLVVAVSLPALELATKFSQFTVINFGAQIKKILQVFGLWFLVSGPSFNPNIGNIFFNQISKVAFVNSFLLNNLWALLVINILIWIGVVVGWFLSARGDTKKKSMVILFSALFAGYIYSRFFLIGENSLTRRLDATLAFLAILCIFNFLVKKITGKKMVFLVILVMSVCIAMSYSIGVETRSVSDNEYTTMQSVWKDIQNDSKYCVVADTYPLLALEEISSKKIIGGGFPINANFAQNERVALYKNFINNPQSEIISSAKLVTGAGQCFVAVEKNLLSKNIPAKYFGNIAVIKY